MSSPDRSVFGSPIPLSDLESVLEWVDSYKLTRPTKKINRDFADAGYSCLHRILIAKKELDEIADMAVTWHGVPLEINAVVTQLANVNLIILLLAEILVVSYPKLVEMHNYPPRNSQAQKLNNWMTLNRKVLKKLKLNLCLKTMEQLSNAIPGAIERVLIMVRDKIKRDDELAKNEEREGQEVSSGGSYYEACSEEDNVLVVPVKQRSGGILETVQKKVVSHEVYVITKEQLKDAKEANETLIQKVEHFENIIKIKEERIDELQRQLARKALRRKENEDLKNSLSIPISLSEPPSPKPDPEYSFTGIKSDESVINSEQLLEYVEEYNRQNTTDKEEDRNTELVNDDSEIKDETKETELEVKERKSDTQRSKIPVKEKTESKEKAKVAIDNMFQNGIHDIIDIETEKEDYYN